MTYDGEFMIFEEVIQEMTNVYLHDYRPWMIGFSGGKDSTLLCCLVLEMIKRLPSSLRKKKVYIVSSDTMVENPIVQKYMHSMNEMINSVGEELNVQADILYPKTSETFWCKVIGLGYPTPEPPGFRWCTERLKINPMNDYTYTKIKNNGEVVILLGVRKAESATRANSIRSHEIEGKLLSPHPEIANAYVYNPLSEIPNELVWHYLLKGDAKTPWGSDNKYLFSLYQGENLGEEQSVIGEIDKDKIPVTGNSRFGCWICTMVKEDKSLMSFINRGETWLIPLREYRNWLIQLRNTDSARETKRRNGEVYLKSDGTLGLGPFTFEARKEILRKLLELENHTGLHLITIDELKEIDSMWDDEGDLTRRCLVDMYSSIKGTKLPWDRYKTAVFPEEVIQEIKKHCQQYEIPFDLICKLIVEINKNKYYTRSVVISKAFDKVLNQGWLHFDTIQRGLNDENQ